MKIHSSEIRKKYLEFFKSKNHAIIESAPLIPENDPSVLFNTAGMQPLVPYLLGAKHPMGNRIVDVQKCVRTWDIDDVGDNTHLTFFEMLGNWSLGDYFKEDSIKWSYEFLTSPEWLWIDPSWLSVTVFEWDESTPRDDFSANVWKSLWIPESRISYLPAEDNWWAAGLTGPCGPDTEIFYWVGEWEPDPNSNTWKEPKKWMEIWNNVFMEYNRLPDGTLENLPAQNVDTGMWLERITATLNHVKSVYQTDIFADVLEKIKEIVWESNYNEKWARIIADHLRSATHMISDWAVPKNVDQWYVLRRLIRRAIREFFKMNYEKPIISRIAKIYIEKFKDVYVAIQVNEAKIIDELNKEEEKFGKTLEKWLKEFDKRYNSIISENKWVFRIDSNNNHIKEKDWCKESWWIFGQDAFTLFDTFWFPLEMTLELFTEKSKELWTPEEIIKELISSIKEEFNKAFEKHQELSKAWAEQKFKWWLADTGTATVEYHTVAHIMLEWLVRILWEHVSQAGSNITAERIRFDFTHSEKMTPEQLTKLEEFVNWVIEKNCQVTWTEISKEEAKTSGVRWVFWERYPDIVRVYTITSPDWEIISRELCGWPHIEQTGWIGKFKIQKEESSSSGVRRIKAVLEK